MRASLRDMWHLWYWANFCPSRLQAPNWIHCSLLLLLFSLPLIIAVIVIGQPSDWMYVVVALLIAFALTLDYSLLAIGLHVPLLVACVYIARATTLQAVFAEILEWPSKYAQMGTGIAAGMLVLIVSTIVGGWLLETNRTAGGQGIIILGSAIAIIIAGPLLNAMIDTFLTSQGWFTTPTSAVGNFLSSQSWFAAFNSGIGTVISESWPFAVGLSVIVALALFAFREGIYDFFGTGIVAGIVAGIFAAIVGGIAAGEIVFTATNVAAGVVAGIVVGIVSGVTVGFAVGTVVGALAEFATDTIGGYVIIIAAGIIALLFFLNAIGFVIALLQIALTIVVGLAGVLAGVVAGATALPLWLLLLIGWIGSRSVTPSREVWLAAVSAIVLMILNVENYNWWTLGIALIVAIGYYRLLPDYAVAALLSRRWAAQLAQAPPDAALGWLRRLPPHTFESLWLPLPGHDRILAAALSSGDDQALETFRAMSAESLPGFRQTAVRALTYLAGNQAVLERIVVGQLAQVRTTHDIEATAARYHPILPKIVPSLYESTTTNQPSGTLPATTAQPLSDSTVLNRLSRMLTIAGDVQAALRAGDSSLRIRGLEQCLENLRKQPVQSSGKQLRADTVEQWQLVKEHWQAIIQTEIAEQQRQAEQKAIIRSYTTRLINSPAYSLDVSPAPVQETSTPQQSPKQETITPAVKLVQRTRNIRSSTASASRELVNPFQTGSPVNSEREFLFKGRKAFSDQIYRQLLDRNRPTLVLHGPRRCGKSSFLLNLSNRLPPSAVLPVFLDLQSPAYTSSDAHFWYGVAQAIHRSLKAQNLEADEPKRDSFRTDTYAQIEDWLDKALPQLESRRVLLCLDEWEKLSAAIDAKRVSLQLLDEVRHLIQHNPRIGFLFAGVQTLDDLAPNWSDYFINVRPIEMLYLEPDEARELITQPDKSFDLDYDQQIIDQILAWTRCHPYLLQLIGEALVTQANKHHTREITQPLLDTAITEALKAGEPYFTDQWRGVTSLKPAEIQAGQALLTVIARGEALPLTVSPSARDALRRFEDYHVIERIDDGFRFEIPLVERWMRDHAVGD